MRIELNINTDGSAQPTVSVSSDSSSTYSNSNSDSNYSSHSHLYGYDVPGIPHPMQMPEHEPRTFYPVDPKMDIGAKPWVKPAAKPLTFINANVVDPASGKLLTGMTLKTKDGKIASLSKTSLTDQYEYTSQVIDAKDYYLCPGLIDSHTHITAVPGARTMAETLSQTRDSTMLRSAWVLKGMLSRGYTTIRDVGGASKAHSDATAEGLIPGPRIFQGGPVVSQTGGHADSTDPNGPVGGGCCAGMNSAGGLGAVCDGVPQCLAMARDIMRKGADHIKICTSGGVGSVTDAIDATQFTIEELLAITTTVKNMRGTITTAHCYTSEGIRHSIAGGVGGIEHGNLLDEPTAKLMAEKGIYLTPTLAVHGIISKPPYGRGFLLDSQLEKNEVVRKAGLEAIQIAEKAGVTVCLGSDMLASMHPLQTNEFVVRASVLPSPTVLKQATCNPAKMLGMEGKIGTLQLGAFADILIMKHNPLEDVTIFDRYNDCQLAVLKEGRVMKSKMDKLVAEVSLE